MNFGPKFKTQREPLTSDPTVQRMKAKFGRPGISGRKTKRTDANDEEVPTNAKIPRFKVNLCILDVINYLIEENST